MYIGYLMMHMRNEPQTGVDVSRIGEILATLACWIDNPVTLPKTEGEKGRNKIDIGRVPRGP